MSSLKELHNLSYDTSGFNSGLINWYNQLIDKTYNDLSVSDVCKMIRQDILKDIAIQKAVDLFICDPYCGEYYDGGLLDVLVSLDMKLINIVTLEKLKTVLKTVYRTYAGFEWPDEDTKIQYMKNVEIMLKSLKKTNAN